MNFTSLKSVYGVNTFVDEKNEKLQEADSWARRAIQDQGPANEPTELDRFLPPPPTVHPAATTRPRVTEMPVATHQQAPKSFPALCSCNTRAQEETKMLIAYIASGVILLAFVDTLVRLATILVKK